VLRQLPAVSDPNLLVGVSTGDDAAVYKLTEDLAIIETVDFFPPIVDDPYTYGAIAAANALSDVYAMGGTPILALNIVGFPVSQPRELLYQILRGGAAKAAEAGVIIVGGHTVDDDEPKYGMAVTGLVRPGRQVTNAGARPGHALVLTKPIGTGIITTAGKEGRAPPEVLAGAVEHMTTLNHAACDVMVKVGVSACTDVTGYGLLGHLRTMLLASGVAARVRASAVPLMEGARDLALQGIAPGGTHRNLESVNPFVRWGHSVDECGKLLLCDAQTSGGLLLSVPAARARRLLSELRAAGVVTTAVIGEVLERAALDGALMTVE
jgi:selenide,water dikinase